ncbi:NitT/TauT family transport system substrate-binding protein [Nonomuraea polychroma]|uniref:NitT/TauT family transport system substrate-binding protein n=1 Tax=Nonomuraea polychroma TaxID=46176 RepID=A0A438M6V3_9ACTN|nr:ABC transporter substrate-binding protein [Nonomuraea polychroma]RVX41426.1 NitT/TauT family transport system substrate-binding protein [Nonomuraea polychroma]
MSRLTRTVATLVLTCTFIVGCSNSDNQPQTSTSSIKPLEKVTYLTSFGNFGRDAYAWVAKDKGFFREAGLDVDIKPGSGTGDNIAKVEAGAAMFAPVDLTGLLLARGSGGAKSIVVVAGVQQRTMAALISLQGNGISKPKDLEGKTLADSPGSVVRNLFPTYAKLAGVDATKVTWVNGAPANLIGLLASGTVAGIGQFVVGEPTVESVAKGRQAVVLPYSDVMSDLYGNVLVTTTTIAREQPDLAKRFIAALMKGLVHSIDNPDETGRILQKNVPASAAAPAAAELTLMSAFVRPEGSGDVVGTIDTKRVAGSIKLLQDAGAVPSGLTPDQLISADLTPKP